MAGKLLGRLRCPFISGKARSGFADAVGPQPLHKGVVVLRARRTAYRDACGIPRSGTLLCSHHKSRGIEDTALRGAGGLVHVVDTEELVSSSVTPSTPIR